MPITEETEQLKSCLLKAVSQVYAEQPSLMVHKGIEQAIVFRVGVYLQEIIQHDKKLSALNLDCEYNKVLDAPKNTPNYPNGIRPDLLLHKRGTHSNNKLAVEFKGWWNTDNDDDIAKLEDLTNPEYDYKYLLGVFVLLNEDKPKYIYFIDGKKA